MKDRNNFLVRTVLLFVALVSAFAFSGAGIAVSAATRSYGVDWSKYQGNYGKYGTAKDKFVIAQIGGVYAGYGYIDQATYNTQVSSAIAAGKYAHTYIWYQVGGNQSVAKQSMDRFLPRIQTPKGSIIALDYEAGASGSISANTDAILYGMNRIKQAGYTPMYYSYKPYTLAHVDYKRILKAYPNSLWIAAYKNYTPCVTPDFGYFPSMDGIAIWQFTSMYGTGYLDGNIDLTGITESGYNGYHKTDTGKVVVKPNTRTSATKVGQVANATSKSAIKAGMTVKVNLSASKWATGQSIPSYIKGHTYTVKQVSGNRVLLNGVMSWANKSDVEILSTTKAVTATTKEYDYSQSGTFSPSVAVNVRTGMGTQYRVTGQLQKGNSIHYNHIYMRGGIVWARYNAYTGVRYVALGVNGGQSYGSRTGVSAASTATVSHTYYTVKSGDSFWSIGSKYGVSMYTIAQRNGMSINHVIHPGQTLLIK